jgi:ATP-dependent Lhr-like helicase
MSILGPVTSRGLAARLGVDAAEVWKQMLRLEMSGAVLRGAFEGPSGDIADLDVEWCERRLLQRIHKATLHSLRKQIEPVTPADYMRFALNWQHLGPQRQLTGESGLLEALRGLEGFEAPAVEWERSLLPQRVANYDPRWLDTLTLTGVVGWGRISPHPAFASIESGGPRRIIPTGVAPITFFLREDALWMDLCLARREIPEAHLTASLSDLANRARSYLGERGAMFPGDLARSLGASAAEAGHALWELVAAGLVTADGFDSLRVLVDSRRKKLFAAPAGIKRAARPSAGRWSLLRAPDAAEQSARWREAAIESACHVLLRRYGVVFRDLMERETAMPKWRDLLGIFRRMEARGTVRGGRFVSGFGGEQFALPEALESLRAFRTRGPDTTSVTYSAADPMNLVDVVVPGEREAAIPGRTVAWPASANSQSQASALPPQEPPPVDESNSLFAES